MSHQAATACPRCDGKLKANGGLGKGTNHNAAHVAIHGARHGHPAMLAVAAGMAAARALFPKTFTCEDCGHTFKE